MFQLNFDALLEEKTNKVTSSFPLKMVIHKQEVTFLPESGASTFK